MALPATILWEVRSTATASNANGGGFASDGTGTDYSQQDAAQYGGTDLASSNGTDAAPQITSATHNFVAADVGNLIYISAGTNWTAGRYYIVSCAGNAATLDRACGSAASLSSGTYAVGGALSLGSSDDAIFEAAEAGHKFWVKSGTYTLGGTVTIAKAGGSQKPIVVEGYASTRGDKPTGSTRPQFDCGAAVFTGGANWDWYNLRFTGSAAGTLTPGASNKVVYCQIINTSTTANRTALTSGANTLAFGCEIVSYRGIGVVTGSSINVIGCYIHDCNVGVQHNSTSAVLVLMDNLIVSNVTSAVHVTVANTARSFIRNNTFYGSEDKLGVGVELVTGVTNMQIMNNIFYGFTTAVNHADVQTVGFDDSNNYYNNTADVANWVKGSTSVALNPGFLKVAQVTGTEATTGASGVLTDAAADFSGVTDNVDYIYIVSGTGVTAGKYLITAHTATTVTTSPNVAADATADKVYKVLTGRNFGAGQSMKAKGFPGTFPGGLTISYTDVGGVQAKIPMRPRAGVSKFGS